MLKIKFHTKKSAGAHVYPPSLHNWVMRLQRLIRFKYYIWLLPQKCILAHKIGFCWKKSLLTRGDDEKSPIEVSSLFGRLKMSKNLEESVNMLQKIWNLAKSEYYPPRLPGTYEHIIIIQITTWITDSPLLIPNTSFIQCCEFYLF